MIIEVDGVPAHAATGGVDLPKSGPILVLIHGAGNDSTVWQLQTRFLAYRGIRVLAVDLPGHGRSEGPPLESIAEMAKWLGRFLRSAGLDVEGGVHIAGHSMGTFVATELAATQPELAAGLVLLGPAASMKVHPELLDAAANDLPRAAALMAAWGHAKPAHVGLNPTPGMWMLGGAMALVENSEPGTLALDFTACDNYDGAEAAAETIKCPVLMVAGAGDKMTPVAGALTLAESFYDAEVVELKGAGHMMMFEDPRTVRAILQSAVMQPQL